MYKKLVNFFLSTSTFLILTSITSFCVFFFSIAGFYDFINVFDMTFNLDKNFFSFSTVETSTTINTEIVARRIGSGLATAGLGGVGTGIGLVFSGLIKGFSRNPSLKDDLFSYAIFGFALTEAIGLFALMMAFMLLYA